MEQIRNFDQLLQAALAHGRKGIAVAVPYDRNTLLAVKDALASGLAAPQLFGDVERMLPLLESVAQMFPKAEIFPASALRRNGMEQLLELIRSHLPEGEAQFPEDQLSTAPMKFMAAEIIREKLFEKLYQEVPYSVAVDVEVWDEEDDRVLIHAAIYVAKPSHKAMVIGRAGEGIKAIGTAARKEIRDLVDKKVHLELWVKVREDWVDDPQFLHSLGFGAEAEY